MVYLVIATIVGIVMTIMGGVLLSLAEVKKMLKPIAYTVLTLGACITGLLALVCFFILMDLTL